MTENQYGQVPKTVLISVKELEKHHANEELRYITGENFERLKTSIKEEAETGYFNARPCIVSDRGDKYTIIAGNHRFEAAKQLGFTEVPCVVLSGLSEADEARLLVKDNGGFAQWEHNALSSFFEAEQLADWGVHAPVVFSDSELETTDFDMESAKGEDVNKDFKITISVGSIDVFNEVEKKVKELCSLHAAKYSVSGGVL